MHNQKIARPVPKKQSDFVKETSSKGGNYSNKMI